MPLHPNLQEFDMSSIHVIRLLAFSTLLMLPGTSRAHESPPIAEQIAKTDGVYSFGQIETIRYTWSLEAPNLKISHTWEWSPKTDAIAYEGKFFFSSRRRHTRCSRDWSSDVCSSD